MGGIFSAYNQRIGVCSPHFQFWAATVSRSFFSSSLFLCVHEMTDTKWTLAHMGFNLNGMESESERMQTVLRTERQTYGALRDKKKISMAF